MPAGARHVVLLCLLLLIPCADARTIDFDEEATYIHGLLSMGLVDHAAEVLEALSASGAEQGRTKAKLRIEIEKERWQYERDPAAKASQLEKVLKSWRDYLEKNPGDLEGKFSFVELLLDHAREGETENGDEKPAEVVEACERELAEASKILDAIIEEQQGSSEPQEDNEILMKARYYRIDQAYRHGLLYADQEKRLEIYKPYIDGREPLVEKFVWDFENWITAYYALLLGGKMKAAVGRYAEAVQAFQDVAGIPENAATHSLRLGAYRLQAEALLEMGEYNACIEAVQRMLSEYGNPDREAAQLIRESPELANDTSTGKALVVMAQALAEGKGRAGVSDAVKILSELIRQSRSAWVKREAQALMTSLQERFGRADLSCDVLAEAAQAALSRAWNTEEPSDWFAALQALQDACRACVEKPAELRAYGAEAWMNLGQVFTQLDRHLEAAYTFERGRTLVEEPCKQPGWPEDLEAADFMYEVYAAYKRLARHNPDYSQEPGLAREQLAREYPNSEQVKEIVYYIGLEKIDEARELLDKKKYQEAISLMEEAVASFGRVPRASSKSGRSLYHVARALYFRANAMADRDRVRLDGKTEPPPPIMEALQSAYDAYQAYLKWAGGAQAATSQTELATRAKDARWSNFQLGRTAFKMGKPLDAVKHYSAVDSGGDREFQANVDFYIVEGLLAGYAQKEDPKILERADSFASEMVKRLGAEHTMATRVSLKMATTYDLLYLEWNDKDQGRAYEYEIKSADWFYEFAQGGNADPENLRAISRKFLKIGDDYQRRGQEEAANRYYRKAVWCLNRYLEAEQDPAERRKERLNQALINYYLGEWQKALDYFEEYHQEHPSEPDIIEKMSWCYVRLGNLLKGYENFSKLVLPTGVAQYSELWWRAKYGIAVCLVGMEPTPEMVQEAQAEKLDPMVYLAKRGVRMIDNLASLARLGYDSDGNEMFCRDPFQDTLKLKPMKELWRDVNSMLQRRSR